MSLTPPPPPPPPHRPSGLAPSGCKTPKLNSTASGTTRRLSTASSHQSPSVPSPNQLRQILADITKQVTNSPQSPLPNLVPARPSPIRSPHPAINRFMRPSLRETGPVTRSRSMLHFVSPRSSLTPRSTRANTPIRDENHSPLHPPTPRTPFTINSSASPSNSRLPSPNENDSGSSSRTGGVNRTPAHPIAPLRYRTLSSVSSASITNPSSSPSLNGSRVSDAFRPPPTPSHPSLRLRPHSNTSASSSSSTPPLTPASSLTSTATSESSSSQTTQPGLSTPRERRSLDELESPSGCSDNKPSPSGSIAKRRRRNPTGLGRL
ncbi:hypothetical protein PCANC_02015 [Puccinia coronata f. sp. avenae]|uniref:Uncharacterized protein n=1 Tax=Puccinia coronata f. sp. avenae TaxID=200324 RepID=A0A2N5W1Y3_9BASI|nr:hypothetical protein PCASD_23252 [Puccinia coronata f. sp. avenae]PLW19743.1 hypothetical protein PCANC_07672 [Puccinia coronata f. sp. avenae]PLW40977.1 hypothetical protein PCASD_06576 [Puccinia coronata f. sp. avenae]PLW56227.1 hypothetical protein PCANC_02015 [Puccinia coronata f. sp. avenae]